ncbi:2Fe-2S ferredoxin [Aureibacter tunicatorum]|uniref:2Fe-2S ferredoxin n=2 Tax=Aureibacter tunicatorum TaxID=866807 RepID=A0AAE3XP75_9BACT|nr:2Fe-2S ferredoxin [Aureibacter tunicatorum]
MKILRIIHENFIDWLHSCGGKGKCTSCKMNVLEGKELLNPPTDFEIKCLSRGLLIDSQRLACSCHFENDGNLVISVPRDTQMKHLVYEE